MSAYLHPEVSDVLDQVLEALLNSNLCVEGVTRRGEFEPCEKLAVALRYDPEWNVPYPVCAFHARADMVSLTVILAAVRGSANV